jgi:hypothetical protein
MRSTVQIVSRRPLLTSRRDMNTSDSDKLQCEVGMKIRSGLDAFWSS